MSFTFRHEPLKTIYRLGAVLYIMGALPVWTVTNLLPSMRPRRSWSLGRCLKVIASRHLLWMLWQTGLPPPASLEKDAKNAKALGFVWVSAAPDLVVGEIREFAKTNGVEAVRTGGCWFGPRGPDGEPGQRASADEKVIYHIHGGGHVFGSAHPGDMTSPLYAGYLKFLGPNYRLFSLEYRISSAAPFKAANPFPASLIDAIAGYRYLVEVVGLAPNQIILSGDSAGAGIALNLARYLVKANLPSLPVPSGMILVSPATDWAETHVGPNSSAVRNWSSDYVQPFFVTSYARRALLGKLPEEMAAKSPWISPGSLTSEWKPGMFAGLPPTIIVAGDAEFMLDQILAARDRLLEDLGEERLKYVGVPDGTHDFVAFDWYAEPQKTYALREISAWVKAL